MSGYFPVLALSGFAHFPALVLPYLLYRFFAARPFTLVANVIAHTAVPAEKITKNGEYSNPGRTIKSNQLLIIFPACDAAATGHMYYINDGVYGSFNCILFDHAHPTGRPLFVSWSTAGLL